MNNRKLKYSVITILTLLVIIIACMFAASKTEIDTRYLIDDANIDVIVDTNKEISLVSYHTEDKEEEENNLEEEENNLEEEYILDNSCIIVVEDEPTYLFKELGDKKKYTNNSVNLRYGPGDEHGIACKVGLNTELVVTHEIDNGWSLVKYKDQELYCSTKLLQDEKVYVEPPVPPFNEANEVMTFQGNVSNACKNKAISLYNLIPSNVRNAYRNWGYKIVVTTSPNLTDGHCGTYYPLEMNSHRVSAVYAKSVGAVNIAVLHETGHFVDNYLGKKEGWGMSPNYGFQAITSDPAWVQIYNAEVGKSGFPSYVTWCPEEFFAECFWKALASPSWMKSHLPQAYNYIMNCIPRV